MDELSDEALIRAVGRGDRQAFRALYRRYGRSVFAYLVRRTGDSANAEDLCQEVFLGLLRAAPRWEPRARVSTLIFRIASNQASKAYRKPLPYQLKEDEVRAIEKPNPEGAATNAEQAEHVRRAVQALDQRQREALLLSHYQGLTYAEVAETLGVPVGTVRSRISRAKAILRVELRELLSLDGGGA